MNKLKKILLTLTMSVSMILTMCSQVVPSYAAETYNVSSGADLVTLLSGNELDGKTLQDGDTIKLSANIDTNTILNINKAVTIDTNGYCWEHNSEYSISVAADLTLIGNGASDPTPAIQFINKGCIYVVRGGTLSIEKIKIQGTNSCIQTQNDSYVSINVKESVILITSNDDFDYAIEIEQTCTLNITGDSRISSITLTYRTSANINSGATLLCEKIYKGEAASVNGTVLSSFRDTTTLSFNNDTTQYDGNAVTVGEANADIVYSYNGDAESKFFTKTWYTYDGSKSSDGYKGTPLTEAPKDIGKYVLELVAPEGILYDTATAIKTIEIKQKDVTVTAKDQTINYGGFISSDNDQLTIEGLLDGHRVASYQMSQSTSGVTTNGKIIVDSVVIEDAYGNVVTNYYNVKTVDGKLTIKAVGTQAGNGGDNNPTNENNNPSGNSNTPAKGVQTSDFLALDTMVLLMAGSFVTMTLLKKKYN